jgi:hypothetical protein
MDSKQLQAELRAQYRAIRALHPHVRAKNIARQARRIMRIAAAIDPSGDHIYLERTRYIDVPFYREPCIDIRWNFCGVMRSVCVQGDSWRDNAGSLSTWTGIVGRTAQRSARDIVARATSR